MSQPITAPPAAVSPRHYQALCGLALAAIFLIQLQQSALATQITLVVNLLILFVGAVGVFYRARISPMVVLIALAAPMVHRQYYANQDFNVHFLPVATLEVADLVLCMAALTYFIGHYRLHGLWFGVLPADARIQLGDAESKPAPPRVRSEESLTASELMALIFTVPAFALVAEVACVLVTRQWVLIELPPRWQQFLAVAWTLLLAMFLAAHAFRYWRRLQLDRVAALILLQDILWNETRGEQRRIQRWMAWKKLQDGKK
jgi:hypothetical protein